MLFIFLFFLPDPTLSKSELKLINYALTFHAHVFTLHFPVWTTVVSYLFKVRICMLLRSRIVYKYTSQWCRPTDQLWTTYILHFSMCVYCNRSQMTSQRVKKKKRTRDEVEWRDCCSLHAVTSSVIYYSTHTRKSDAICVCVSFNRSRSTTNENAHRSHVIV